MPSETDDELPINLEQWVPPQMRERLPGLSAALAALDTNLHDAEAATVVLWETLFLQQDEGVEHTLRALEERMRPSGHDDYLMPDTERDVYLLVAASLLAILAGGDNYREGAEAITEKILGPALGSIRNQPVATAPLKDPVDYTVRASICAAAGIINRHCARLKNRLGNPEDALHHFGRMLDCWTSISQMSDAAWFHSRDLHDEDWWNELMEDESALLRASVGIHLSLKEKAFDVQEVADAFFELLQPSNVEPNWQLIQELCWRLRSDWCQLLEDAEIKDRRSKQGDWSLMMGWYWPEFWSHAEAIARERLFPNQLWKSLKREAQEGSKRRLTKYFLSQDAWDSLPVEAQGRLVNAERAYFEDGGWRSSLFNDLLRALQALLRPMLYQPFFDWVTGQEARRSSFQAVGDSLRRSPRDAGVDDMLRNMWGFPRIMDEFLATLNLDPSDRAFLRDKLRKRLAILVGARNDAEYRSRNFSEECAAIINSMLGIGCEGVIPRLARIAKKLNSPT